MTRISGKFEEPLEDFCAFETIITFDLEGEDCPAEPYSWNGSRGNEVSIIAEIVSVKIGALILSRDEFIAACTDSEMNGEDYVRRIEALTAERACEQYERGDLAA